MPDSLLFTAPESLRRNIRHRTVGDLLGKSPEPKRKELLSGLHLIVNRERGSVAHDAGLRPIHIMQAVLDAFPYGDKVWQKRFIDDLRNLSQREDVPPVTGVRAMHFGIVNAADPDNAEKCMLLWHTHISRLANLKLRTVAADEAKTLEIAARERGLSRIAGDADRVRRKNERIPPVGALVRGLRKWGYFRAPRSGLKMPNNM